MSQDDRQYPIPTARDMADRELQLLRESIESYVAFRRRGEPVDTWGPFVERTWTMVRQRRSDATPIPTLDSLNDEQLLAVPLAEQIAMDAYYGPRAEH